MHLLRWPKCQDENSIAVDEENQWKETNFFFQCTIQLYRLLGITWTKQEHCNEGDTDSKCYSPKT